MKRAALTAKSSSKRLKLPQQNLPANFIKLHSKAPHLISGLEHCIKVDPSLLEIVTSKSFPQWISEPIHTTTGAFLELVNTIIGQQIHGKAAKSIEEKFYQLFKDQDISPSVVLEIQDEKLRECGLSGRKISYIRHLSHAFASGEITIELLDNGSNEEIIQKLVQLKGIGDWTAKVFLIFALHKLDVFTALDLGIARGFSKFIVGREHLLALEWETNGKKPHFDNGKKKKDWKVYHERQIERVSQEFEPFRSIFMFILWRYSSTELGQFSLDLPKENTD